MNEELFANCEIIPENGLVEKLKLDRPLVVKLGVDPTRPDLHLGHLVTLKKLKLFQEAGHKVVLIIGDFTSRIGDPTGQNQTRPMLSEEEIEENAKTYIEQIGKFINIDSIDIVWNSNHLDQLNFTDLIRLTSKFTVSNMLARDDFSNRLDQNEPVGLHEILYPLAQAADSVEINADVEIGGTDQLFNIMMGRELQKSSICERSKDPQVCLTVPLLVGTDGKRKMSKTYNNYIAFTDSADDIFGKTMSIPDHLIRPWFDIFFNSQESFVKKEKLDEKPFEFKQFLALMLVQEFFNVDVAQKAKQRWQNMFSKRQLPSDIPEFVFENKILVDLISDSLNESKSNARRLITGNSVKVDSEPITDINFVIQPNTIVKIGKRRFIKVIEE